MPAVQSKPFLDHQWLDGFAFTTTLLRAPQAKNSLHWHGGIFSVLRKILLRYESHRVFPFLFFARGSAPAASKARTASPAENRGRC